VVEDVEVKTMIEDDTTSKLHCFPQRFLPPRVRLLFLACFVVCALDVVTATDSLFMHINFHFISTHKKIN
jgi:hypothetical protein